MVINSDCRISTIPKLLIFLADLVSCFFLLLIVLNNNNNILRDEVSVNFNHAFLHYSTQRFAGRLMCQLKMVSQH